MAASRLQLNMDKTELKWTGTKYNVSEYPRLLSFFDTQLKFQIPSQNIGAYCILMLRSFSSDSLYVGYQISICVLHKSII